MEKKIYVHNKVYDLNTISTEKIMSEVQKKINTIWEDPETSEVHVSFDLTIDEEAEKVIMHYKRANIFARQGTDAEYINDIDALLMAGLRNRYTGLPVMWTQVKAFGPSLHGRYDVEMEDFKYAYTESALKRGASKIKDIHVECTRTDISLILEY